MKKNILTSIGLTAFFVVAIMSLNVIVDSNTSSVHAFTGGSPGGRTSSPGDGSNCTACHSGTINSGSGVAGIVATGLLTSGYTPGQTYTITGSISETGITEFGFELTAERDADNSKVGTFVLTDATNTKFVNSNNAVSHTTAGTSPLVTGAATWSMDWTAPAAGTGDVTFYAAFNSTNDNGANSGDKIYSSTFSVSEEIQTGLNEDEAVVITSLFPNPVKTSFEVSSSNVIENVVIYDLAGKKMNKINQIDNVFDASNLSSGIYFVQIKTADKTITKKIIKE